MLMGREYLVDQRDIVDPELQYFTVTSITILREFMITKFIAVTVVLNMIVHQTISPK